jgi:hypothetical protein
MPKRELTEREFANLRSVFPTLVLDADQWAEHGFFYDPVDRRFGVYAIDRKEQVDEVETFDAAEDLFVRCAAEHQAALKAWLDGLKPQIG